MEGDAYDGTTELVSGLVFKGRGRVIGRQVSSRVCAGVPQVVRAGIEGHHVVSEAGYDVEPRRTVGVLVDRLDLKDLTGIPSAGGYGR